MPNLVVDTNILFVFVVGSIDVDRLGRTERLKEYRPADYDTVLTYLSLFRRIVLLPNVVTETSNFIGNMKGSLRQACAKFLAKLVTENEERYVASALAVSRTEYTELGVTDAAILCVLDDDTFLLTADFGLYLAAQSVRRNAQLFQELRS